MFAVVFLAAFPAEPAGAEKRALAFLAREVPDWPAEHRCFSCHNSGVAATALYRAKRQGHDVPKDALAATTRYLTEPGKWHDPRKDSTPTDRTLVRVQFGAALAEAVASGDVTARAPSRAAARLIAAEQREDGSWQVSADGTLGSPTTLGPVLATHLARRVLGEADADGHRAALAKAERWLKRVKPDNVLDAAALILALGESQEGMALIRKAQDKGGGWGPYASAAPEPFDTAVVLLALAPRAADADIAAMIRRGRAYLVASQDEDGAWPATTRPAGEVSYAQRCATAGWATQALLATGRKD